MAKRITTLSNRYKTRPNDRLDSDRYQFLDITQAEPNPGSPESDGMLLSSLASGVRSWTNELTLRGLDFIAGSLDSATNPQDVYVLTVRGNPFDGINDSIGVKKISDFALGFLAEETDTLDTVTTRGNTTLNDITVGKVTADSAVFNLDVIIQGNLTVNGTTTTLNTQDLIVEDKNIILAFGAPSALAADSAGITVAGANAKLYYSSDSDAWRLNKRTTFESGIYVHDSSTFLDSARFYQTTRFYKSVQIDSSLTAGLTVLDSTNILGTLKVQVVPTATTQYGLFLEPDGTISKQLVEAPVFSGIASRLTIQQTNNNATFYPLFVDATSGDDSVNIDLNLTYNASTNRLSLGKLGLVSIVEQPSALKVLTIDANDSVGFKNINDIVALAAEVDTLDTVTTRGNTTTNAITVADLTAELTNLDSTTVNGNLKFTKALLDNSNRRLLIYDSTGSILWGA